MDDRERILSAISYVGLAQRLIRRGIEGVAPESAFESLADDITMALVYLGRADALVITGADWRWAVMGLQRVIVCMCNNGAHADLVMELERVSGYIDRVIEALERLR